MWHVHMVAGERRSGSRGRRGRFALPSGLAAFALVALASGGCGPGSCAVWDRNGDGTVEAAILGDSNSLPGPRTWSGGLEKAMNRSGTGRWRVRVFARAGATLRRNPAHPSRAGRAQTARALAARPPVELAVLAFGTNDHIVRETPAQVVEAYRAAVGRLEGAGVAVLLATTPPCWRDGCDRDLIAMQNELLREVWPAAPLIDFSSWVTRRDMLDDGLHFLPSSQRTRLEVAVAEMRRVCLAAR